MKGPPPFATIHTLTGVMLGGVLHLVGARKRRIRVNAFDGKVKDEKPPVVKRRKPHWRRPG